ncbi:MAG: hypothetical protein RL077_3001 [Verrucomicrobiota bacterium]
MNLFLPDAWPRDDGIATVIVVKKRPPLSGNGPAQHHPLTCSSAGCLTPQRSSRLATTGPTRNLARSVERPAFCLIARTRLGHAPPIARPLPAVIGASKAPTTTGATTPRAKTRKSARAQTAVLDRKGFPQRKPSPIFFQRA